MLSACSTQGSDLPSWSTSAPNTWHKVWITTVSLQVHWLICSTNKAADKSNLAKLTGSSAGLAEGYPQGSDWLSLKSQPHHLPLLWPFTTFISLTVGSRYWEIDLIIYAKVKTINEKHLKQFWHTVSSRSRPLCCICTCINRLWVPSSLGMCPTEEYSLWIPPKWIDV